MSETVLVLGAGQSAPYLIKYLLENAAAHDWRVVVADRDEAMAQARVGGHPRGRAVALDAKDTAALRTLVADAKVVVNFLAPMFQHPVAELCLELGRHMVSASYQDRRVGALHDAAVAKNVTLLCELGLDPGMDHMSAMKLIHALQAKGGVITSFCSYGSGVPALDSRDNPLGYAITWNPRNVVMSGEAGAQYLLDGRIKVVPYPDLFHRSWPVEVPGVGTMEAYPNRDSLSYKAIYGLADAETLIRGTLRYPGYCETWYQVARLGLPNERIPIPNLAERTWAELTDMFLPPGEHGSVRLRAARHLGISPGGTIMKNLEWLGIFDDTPTGAPGETAAEAMIHLLKGKLRLPPRGRDMVILAHELLVHYPDEGGRKERVTSTLVDLGEPDGLTAMSKTVGLPAALGARLLMTDSFPRPGSFIPIEPVIYEPMLEELAQAGLTFEERVEAL
ncbi:MAG: saccharopine dehydrogenase NADP-binding domain-containing protein [Myxococcales bacterium]|nr:saccharopine dehydrogenase NADP-binding domain-containing protein [Myxococcales bacterium]